MKFKDILLELAGSDEDILKAYGYKIIDRYDIGGHTMILIRGGSSADIQIGLTTGDMPFSSQDNQSKIPLKSPVPNIKFIYFKLMEKIREWLMENKTILIGSYNHARVEKYWKLCKIAGINVTDIESSFASSYFYVTR